MSDEATLKRRERTHGGRGVLVKRVLLTPLATALLAAILFAAAGTLRWPTAWVYTGLFVVVMTFTMGYLQITDPALMDERFDRRKEVKAWDRFFVQGSKTLMGVAVYVVAGLDRRWGWSPPHAPGVQIAAGVVWLLGNGLMVWAMASNTFFSDYVRIQSDRGQTPVSGGPYRFVRHPGYASMIVYGLATAPLLASVWALIPAGLAALLLVIRTALEDRTLQNELPGYTDYTRQTRFRLLPGVW